MAMNQSIHIISRKLIFLSCISVLNCTVFSQNIDKSPPRNISVGIEHNYPPFSISDKNNKPSGICIDIINEISQTTGLNAEIFYKPWNQIRKGLESGSLDVICGMYASSERDRLVDFTQPISIIHHAVFHRHGTAGIKHIIDLKGKRVIIMREDLTHDFIRSQQYCRRPLLANTQEEALKMLASGQGDFALLAKLPALYYIQLHNLKIRTTGPACLPSKYCIAVKKGDKLLLTRLQKELSHLIRSGRLNEFNDYWTHKLNLNSDMSLQHPKIRIGVLAKRGQEKCRQKWNLTIDYLNKTIPDYRFTLTPLNFDAIEPALIAGEIDFLLANPSIYVNFEKKYGIQRIATLKNKVAGNESTQFGGVIFTRSDNTHIQSLADLKGVSFMAVHPKSFGGWQTTLKELKKNDINPNTYFSELKFGNTHDAVVLAVKNGSVTAGTVRSDTLERMTAEGIIDIKNFQCLTLKDNNKKPYQSYPYLYSTELYPEWPLAQAAHVPNEWAETVSSALLSMRSNTPAAKAANCAGWTVPHNYTAVHNCLKAIGAPPYENTDNITIQAVWNRYRNWIILIICALILISSLSLYATWLSHKLSREGHKTRRLNRLLRTISNINQLITHEQRRDELLQKACNILTENNEYYSAWIMLLDQNEKFLLFKQSGENSFLEPLLNELKKSQWTSCLKKALSGDTTLIIDDPSKQCHDCPISDAYNNCASFVSPLIYNNQTYGVLAVSLPKNHINRQDERNLFREIVTDLAFALHDINSEQKRKLAENKLSNALHSLDSILDNSPFPLWVAAPDGKLIRANRALCNILKTESNKLVNHYNILKDKNVERAGFSAQVRDVFEKHKSTNFVLPWEAEFNITADITVRNKMILDMAIFPIVNKDGKLINVVCQWLDITERQKAQKMLIDSEKRFRSYVENSPHGVFIAKTSGQLTETNPSASKITGYSKEELLLKSFHDLVTETAKAKGSTFFTKVCNNNNADGVLPFIRKDGTKGILDITAVHLTNNTILGFMHDITDRLHMENQLYKAQKLDAIGQLAGGIAHDFNNMLMGVMGFTELCRSKVEKGHPICKWLNEITTVSKRSAGMVRQLLAFSRKQTIVPKIININDTIGDMINMLNHLIGENITLQWVPQNELAFIKIDPGQIDQILANLCLNSRDAISGNGTITISTANVRLDNAYSESHTGTSPGEYIKISVIDNGCGMDAETTTKVFDPFFTTKNEDNGTGLGLASVYGIVKQNYGTIDVKSEIGKGTTIEIFFPCYKQAEKKPVKQSKIKNIHIHGKGKTIMLVEDERSIRITTRIFLEQAGYTVLDAESPQKALEIIEHNTTQIDLLLTDIIMPGMNGKELADKLLNKIPDLKVLYMSGYTADIISHKSINYEDSAFMAKPISRNRLIRKISSIFEMDETSFCPTNRV